MGASHNSRYALFGDGRTASSGLQSLAERGRIDILRVEMQDADERGRLGETFEGEGFGVPGIANVTRSGPTGAGGLRQMDRAPASFFAADSPTGRKCRRR